MSVVFVGIYDYLEWDFDNGGIFFLIYLMWWIECMKKVVYVFILLMF